MIETEEFLNQLVGFWLPNGQIATGYLEKAGDNFYLNNNLGRYIGVTPETIKEVRKITAPDNVNLLRAIFVIQGKEVANEAA